LAPFWQGLDAQSSMLTSQKVPRVPLGQLQLNELTPSMHLPPLKQDSDVQSSMLISHFLPLKPLGQRQK